MGGSNSFHKDHAIRTGNIALIKRHFSLRPWLVKKINIASYDAKGSTALHLAAEYGQEEMCALLVERGADPEVGMLDTKDKNKSKGTAGSITPLGSALLCQSTVYKKVNLKSQKNIIKALVGAGGKINSKTHDGSYMLLLCERISTHYDKGVEDIAVYCFDTFPIEILDAERERWGMVAKMVVDKECNQLQDRLAQVGIVFVGKDLPAAVEDGMKDKECKEANAMPVGTA
ncbi:hypothetical protein SARC_08749 [Sphaeroforma arctica JP610]|uniref:Uncharacterized protein n=1 Tax=Sphaeroforma arctica JP610 TaxID=667725 RepID=A0A0L0FPV4_9EUKA|nr:hypothetical protein SARC_08749 [Sphaeroforma arctica JP610]KNC78832.1 hypothetical protein SARC_08749 [Sphaeroforma arctica JP610]|eukprot:XP_014152734.1 hypothetical protein SARC_08749 [Sphaeroforma arctica JP610]